MVMIRYSAPQLGQAKTIGSDLFGKVRAGIAVIKKIVPRDLLAGLSQ